MKKKNELTLLITKSQIQLTNLLNQNYQKLSDHKFAVSFRKEKNIRKIRDFKKIIARIWTVISEKMN